MLSIYVHWPFCLAKCPYCDFNSHVAPAQNHKLWLEHYHKELDFFSNIIKKKYIKSIFFGGGTPSLMSPFIVEGIIKKISDLGKIDLDTEITLEANPTSFEIEKFRAFKAVGINRVSIGVQSLVDDDLIKLGRQHNAMLAKKAIGSAKQLFDRVSFDLIYARPGQTLQAWQKELSEAMEFATGHLSLYQLTIEKGTIFYKLHKKGDLIIPPGELAADMYELTNSVLETRGLFRYEISNYAKYGDECKHNLVYWHYDDYLGIGPGAHSRLSKVNGQKEAMMMHHLPAIWLNEVSQKGCGMQSKNILSKKDTATEFLMMGLRLVEGVNLAKFGKIIGKSTEQFIDLEVLKQYVEIGLIKQDGQVLALTDRGLMLHNYLVPRLIKD